MQNKIDGCTGEEYVSIGILGKEKIILVSGVDYSIDRDEGSIQFTEMGLIKQRNLMKKYHKKSVDIQFNIHSDV